MSDTLSKWINPEYLTDSRARDIRESVLAKPGAAYAVLDGFFREEALSELIEQHKKLEFSEELDRRAHGTGELLPYDGSVVFANKGHVGADLFFDDEWHEYLAYISGCRLKVPASTEIKLRWHKPNADGFWIHTDSTIRTMVAITYFNKDWVFADGGLLQLWKAEPAMDPRAFHVEAPKGRLDFLNHHRKIRTSTPGGGFPDGKPKDLVLIDQIVPAYNRLFVCNYQDDPAYHSVTPSNGKARTGVVQWIGHKI